MSQRNLERILAGTYPDPDGGGMLSVPVRAVVIDSGLAAVAGELIAPLDLGARLAVVMDAATRHVAGEAVIAALAGRGRAASVVLGDAPHPDMDTVRQVMAESTDADGLVAVGSGSINDITKHAAHLVGKPYAVFGTAPSMNGYTSVSAAITEDGLKKSLPSTAPRGVFLDLDVLAAAPKRLIAAGFGDSICRSTAQTDWLLSHLMTGTPYREAPFALLAEDEAALIAGAAALAEGDRTAIGLLAHTLVMSGFGMTICGGSYPASQSEHLVAHYMDMLGHGLPPAYHGEHIAVTTLSIARLQERIIGLPSPTVRRNGDSRGAFQDCFGPALGDACWQSFLPKFLDDARVKRLQEAVDERWPDVRERLKRVGRPATEIESALRAAGGPTKPSALGIPGPFYREALLNARKIRDRFGILDLAEAAGELEAFVAGEVPMVEC
ncbi:MAG: iron-containing alcohol dehydrogenase [Hyphomicrobiaceae bacterium]|nr:iron-containing alcohol dehydrogenase [Hyphomicrobiaceae bacterium]